ncbi:carbonic anhydrase [Klebsormidium nitens]|uniref:Carbonic anhydrase n=1 Tax=Klebsormidium nitens TaxID=105231 RepID=A0A1Y1I4I6_KLENI|nr:carbonic anhydrase [Klebsormidium nitens]|eukprot:GAQ84872.1 carbonic anhydrase [Klebsormidium nitens]
MAAALVKSQFYWPGHLVRQPSNNHQHTGRIQASLHNAGPVPTPSAQRAPQKAAATEKPLQSQERKDNAAMQTKDLKLVTPSEARDEASKKRAPLISRERVNHQGRRSLLTKGLMAAALCPLCSDLQHASAAEWGYGGPAGPLRWGGFCILGRQQSPIDMPVKGTSYRPDTFGKLQFDYHAADVNILNTGHGTMQVNFPAGSSTLRVGKRTLDLLQFHFHSPSEHAVDGERFDMEAHMVHKDRETGTLAVVGTLLQAVPDVEALFNPALEAALQLAPREHGAMKPAAVCAPTCINVKVSAEDLLPVVSDADSRSYFHYAGSLTTPPCSEGVDWFMMGNTVRIPYTQLVSFLQYVGDQRTLAFNTRPLQPIRDREITRGPA